MFNELKLPIKSKFLTFNNKIGTIEVYNHKTDETIGIIETIGSIKNYVFTSKGKFIYDERTLTDIMKALKYLKVHRI